MSGKGEGAVRELTVTSDLDLSIWLEENSIIDPVLYPFWPEDFPLHVPVFCTEDEDFGAALSRQAMIDARRHDRLWFIVHADALIAHTSAEKKWFTEETTNVSRDQRG